MTWIGSDDPPGDRHDPPGSDNPSPADADLLRDVMVSQQIRRRGIEDERVLAALREVPRHLFVPGRSLREAYADAALPIGHRQTISQPYIVAFMTDALRPWNGEVRVLEVGTGSGYQAAVLAACGATVFTVERIPALHRRARSALEQAGYADRVFLRLGDGTRGWEEEAPFDRIVLTAAAPELPDPIVRQLSPDGIIVAPVGGKHAQHIYRYRRGAGGELDAERLEGARFVPLIPEAPDAES